METETLTAPMSRTRAALAEFDRIGALMDEAIGDESADYLNGLAAQYAAAQRKIGEAFYLDTSDRNFPECAEFSMCMEGLAFMRECVERAS
jgi:hypothetical protein